MRRRKAEERVAQIWNEYYDRWQGVETNSPTAVSRIHHTAWVAPWVTYGRNVVIGPNCSIGWEGFGYEQGPCGRCSPDDTACPPCPCPVWKRRDHNFGVVIGDDVEIGAGVTIDRGRYRDTVIGRGTKIDANVFIAHNVEIGEDCLVIANSQISGSCVIGDRCHIGPAAMLTDHVTVGNQGRCGLGAVVIRDVPAGVTVVGNPARDLESVRKARIAEGMGDGSDDFPGSHGDIADGSWDMSEVGQRQRAKQWQ